MTFNFDVSGGDFNHAGAASSELKRSLRQLGIHPDRVRRIVVALYEAEVNIVAHAHYGNISVDVDEKRVLMIVDDKGPGIPDIRMAMQEGFSTAGPKVREMGFGAGMGLPNIKKNTDHMKIESVEGKGTRLEMLCYLSDEPGIGK